jgi:receptor expression-enhancing protein 1/2/3/4
MAYVLGRVSLRALSRVVGRMDPGVVCYTSTSESSAKSSANDTCINRVPFYAYIRLLFLLYLVLPQTQGARILYQTYIHPWLEENETQIEDFIASAHERLRAQGIASLKKAIELLRVKVFGLPPGEPEAPTAASASSGAQSYTQSLLARFSLPSARWSTSTGAGGQGAASDFYSLLAGAVSAMTTGPATAPRAQQAGDLSASGTLIPPNIREGDRAAFLATQRERLSTLLGALDREAAQLKKPGSAQGEAAGGSGSGARFANPWSADGTTERPASGLSKSRSEADFEKIDAESGAEDLDEGLRKRGTPAASSAGSWMPWGWGAGGEGKSSGVES